MSMNLPIATPTFLSNYQHGIELSTLADDVGMLGRLVALAARRNG